MLAGVVASMLPPLHGMLVGFTFHPAITLGATCGSRTGASALAVVQGALKGRTPALGFTTPCAAATIAVATRPNRSVVQLRCSHAP